MPHRRCLRSRSHAGSESRFALRQRFYDRAANLLSRLFAFENLKVGQTLGDVVRRAAGSSAPNCRYLGVDEVLFTGRCEKPAILHITREEDGPAKFEFLDGSDLARPAGERQNPNPPQAISRSPLRRHRTGGRELRKGPLRRDRPLHRKPAQKRRSKIPLVRTRRHGRRDGLEKPDRHRRRHQRPESAPKPPRNSKPSTWKSPAAKAPPASATRKKPTAAAEPGPITKPSIPSTPCRR